MYCPKCAAQNHDLEYCRECGENLQIISQVMKKHLPVAFVSKLDAIVEKKNERFRRDAILGALLGASFLILSVFTPLYFTILNFFMFLVGTYSLLHSGWCFLAYLRSLEPRKKPLGNSDESLPLNISEIGTLESAAGAVTNKLVAGNDSRVAFIYCPRCGAQNLENVLYCCACGTNLDFKVRPQGLERYLPAFLMNKLDALIIKNENEGYKSQHKSGWTLLFLSGIYLFNVIIHGLQGNWGLATFYLVLGIAMIVTSGWNLVAYRRNLDKENKSLDETSTAFSSELWMFFSTNSKAAAAIVIFTLIAFGLAYSGIATGVILRLLPFIMIFAPIIIVASFLKFRQNLRSENDKQFSDNATSITKELKIQDTQNTLSHSSPQAISITEATTRPLDLAEKQDGREKISTVPTPVKPRS